ncbi:MAG TPA: SDR family oxidoreductase [Gaiellaceae bacterium]|nr:SDR family oxidoreductase [Gaiellaceae bacterium]
MTRVALVTGGGTGIGAAVARRLAGDGFRVCVSGRRLEPLEAVAAETGGLAVTADTRDEGEVAALLETVRSRLGSVGALVCCAGTGAAGTVLEQTLERWETVLSTNLTGVFLVCRAALPHLLETKGSIVTISSLGGLCAAPASAAYNASKAGLIMLTQCLAVDHGAQGVRANCICPGWIRTPMADEEMDALGPDREEAYARANALNPLRRPGSPEEVAGAVAWLVGPEASYVNGAVLSIDGGVGALDAGMAVYVA